MLHSKLLNVRSSALANVSTGRVYSLVTNDVQRFDNLLPFVHAPRVAVSNHRNSI